MVQLRRMGSDMFDIHATYIGPNVGWNIAAGMGALIRPSEKVGYVEAQFDDHHAQRNGIDLSTGWHKFLDSDFKADARCPECGSPDYIRIDREGDMLAPEATYFVCNDCGHESDQE